MDYMKDGGVRKTVFGHVYSPYPTLCEVSLFTNIHTSSKKM